jgi:hypothetical protein
MLRLDGQYGTGAVLTDLAGFCYVTRGKDYTVLDRTEVQSRLHLPSDQQFRRPESDRGRVPSTTARMCRWGQRDNAAGW